MHIYSKLQNTIFFFLLIFLLVQITFAQKSGTIEDEVWRLSNSPFYITGDIIVKSLTIEPGVKIYFDGNFRFDVSGTLIAEGTKSDSILFALNPIMSSGWVGISFDSLSSDSRLTYVIIHGTNTHALKIDNSSPKIKKCRIQHNNSRGIEISNGQVILENCTIANNNDQGVYVSFSGKAILTNCTVFSNGRSGIHIDGGTAHLKNCIISYNEDDGILVLSASDSLYLINSVISKNADRGILSFSGTVHIRNSIIYHNDFPSANPGGGELLINYSAFETENWPNGYEGSENISDAPLFQDDTLFTLTTASPCVDKGDPDPLYDDLCFPPSLGAERNDMGAYGGPLACKWYEPLYVTPHFLNFGNVTLDSTDIHTVTIKNFGDSVLNIASATFSGQDAANFNLNYSHPVVIAPYDSLHLEIEFTPDETGLFSAQLQIVSDAGTDSVSLIGNGVVASILVTSALDFESVSVGDSLLKNLIIRNGGSDSLRIFSLYNSRSVYRILQAPLLINIPPLQSDTLLILFKPDSSLEYIDSLEIISNDPDDNPLYVILQGTGLAPVLSLIPLELDFGQVLINQDSTMYLELNNSGNDTLQINSIEIIDANSMQFSFDSDLPSEPIPPESESEIIAIRFTPSSVGSKSADLRFYSNDPFENPFILPLRGSGVVPEIYAANDSINFGNVPVEKSVSHTLQISNQGTAALKVTAVEIRGTDSTLFSVLRGSTGFVIPPAGVPDTIEVEFSPDAEGIKRAYLKIDNNDPEKNPVTISLQGNGVIAPEIFVASDSIDFGEHYISERLNAEVTIFNIGQIPLQIGRSQIFGEHASDFNIFSGGDSSIIAAGTDSHTVQISFIPQADGLRYAQLSIPSNDPLNNPMQILLLGTGLIDDTPAVIITDSSAMELVKGISFTFTVNISDEETTIREARLLFREGGKQSFIDSSMTQINDSLWSALIPGDFINERGLEYYITATHGGTTSTFPQVVEDIPAVALVDVDILTFNEKTLQGAYQMISIPANTNNHTLKDLFADNLGEYGDTEYRFFDWDHENSRYSELSAMNVPLPAGKALWLITRFAEALDVADCQSISTSQNYPINLHAGWNMFGVPFAFSVSWDSVESSGEMPQHLHHYDGYGWINDNILLPFKGYAVYSADDVILYFPPHETELLLTKPNITEFQPGEWQIQIKAVKGDYHDNYNFVGVKNIAKQDLDQQDVFEPPPIGEFISLFLESIENEGSTVQLAGDYRSPDKDQYIFDIKVISNFAGNTHITFIPQNLPADFDWAVVSKNSKIKYSKNELNTEHNQKELRMIVGSESVVAYALRDYRDIPEKFSISQNFPNPFNPTTTIRFQLPKESELSIRIYDILGRKVKTLLDNEYKEAGYYQIQWDGTNGHGQKTATGIYLLYLKAAEHTQVIKMVMER